jgi:hypothetical protein
VANCALSRRDLVLGSLHTVSSTHLQAILRTAPLTRNFLFGLRMLQDKMEVQNTWNKTQAAFLLRPDARPTQRPKQRVRRQVMQHHSSGSRTTNLAFNASRDSSRWSTPPTASSGRPKGQNQSGKRKAPSNSQGSAPKPAQPPFVRGVGNPAGSDFLKSLPLPRSTSLKGPIPVVGVVSVISRCFGTLGVRRVLPYLTCCVMG